MFVPEFFYGKFSDVEKKFKSLRSKNITLEAVQKMYDTINQGINDEIYHDFFVISLTDTWFGRKMPNAYYPFVFSNYVTFEEELDNSDIIRWFKEKSKDLIIDDEDFEVFPTIWKKYTQGLLED